MPHQPPPRFASQASSWSSALLACLLSVLLLAAAHCSSYLASDNHKHLSLSAPTAGEPHDHSPDEPGSPDRPQHDHGASCALAALADQAQAQAAIQSPVETTVPLVAAALPLPVGAAPAAARGPGRTPIVRTGRSTLTRVCRWRV